EGGGRPAAAGSGVGPAVKQAQGDVASLVVGTEHVLPAGVPELRPDRDTACVELAAGIETALRDNLDLFPVTREALAQMARVRTCVRHMVRVERRTETEDDNGHEDEQEAERDVVPAQPPPGEIPRALALDRAFFLRGQ